MPQAPALPDPRRDEDPRPASSWPDWMDDPAYLAMRSIEEEPGEGEDPDDAPPPDVDEAELAAAAAEVLAAQERLAAVTGRLGLTAALAAGTAEGSGRRGRGMPGSTGSFPGVYASRASGSGSGKPLDTAPGKARQRREHAAKKTRVERWAEGSGNAGLAGRELPPAEVLAADQRVTAWAEELRKAGLDGGMDRAAGPRVPGYPARPGLPAPSRQTR